MSGLRQPRSAGFAVALAAGIAVLGSVAIERAKGPAERAVAVAPPAPRPPPARDDSSTSAQTPPRAAATAGSTIPREIDLTTYLSALEERARSRGSVDDEIALGVRAYREAHRNGDGRRASIALREFASRMKLLERKQHLAPVLARLDGLAQRIANEKDARNRAALLDEYNAVTATLPPVERALARRL